MPDVISSFDRSEKDSIQKRLTINIKRDNRCHFNQ